ncbi:kinase-like domain-containing protein [Rhizophagus clarus]|uniref:Kinase-like domain-containing protein n=1 Tax=Rhizophagus clarus TaxID=94130 RepID=A0A8H3KUL5_9GLOM|nr:kinase-like domain-containing protein [Rhizophagus clarus]
MCPEHNLKIPIQYSLLVETSVTKIVHIAINSTKKLWCKECNPFNITEGWTSGNPDIYKFIKESKFGYDFLEWVPFDRFTDVREIGEGGFAKVYSATWIDSKSNYYINDDGNYKKMEAKRKAVALRKLNESQNMPEKYLNELKIHWNLFKRSGLQFYGLTKESETKEFMMVLRGKKIKNAFEDADKEIPSISISYEKNSNAVYTSRAFKFGNLVSKPLNFNEEGDEVHDFQLVDLDISSVM